MSVALFIVLSAEEPGFDAFVNGKAVAAEFEALEALAARLGLTPLSSFVSADPDELAGFMEGEGLDSGEVPLESEAWSDPDAGLATVTGLLEHLTTAGRETRGATEIAEDLRDVERVLREAKAHGLTWHLQWDY